MAELPRLNCSLVPEARAWLELPEKAVQFGTGAFLRGFVDCFVDAANRAGAFGGRVVAIGSTGSGRDQQLNEQNGLFTLALRGVEHGVPRREYTVITALSRALSASDQWEAVLACSRNPALELIFSNTTETGIRLDAIDTPGPGAPRSFPGKLTRFLYERARTFEYAPDCAPVVLPCELIENNGDRLREITLELAHRWELGSLFTQWLERSVPFCNTLVDRIVPGAPPPLEMAQAWQELGYRDELLTVAEIYRLFAIQADDKTAERLTFWAADPNVIVAADIRPYRQRKLRLLNGTHTIMVSLALLAGCRTVREAFADEAIGAFARRLLLTELVPTVQADNAELFAHELLDRFANPYVDHALIDITLQHTTKMRVRIVPAILDYTAQTGRAPASLALGFAAYLLYIRTVKAEAPADEHADRVRSWWRTHGHDTRALARRVCSERELWDADLTCAPGFVNEVADSLQVLLDAGVRTAVDQHLAVSQEL